MVQAEVVTRLVADNQLGGDLSNAKTQVSSFGSSSQAVFAGVAGGLGAGLAIAAFKKVVAVGMEMAGFIKDFALESIEFANIQIKVENSLDRTVKTMGSLGGHTADAVKQFASMRQSFTTFGDEETLKAANNLATFGKVQGDVYFRGLEAAQDMSAFLGNDLFNSVTGLGKALNDPITGMALLTKQGSLTKDEAKAIGDELIETGDIMKAQNSILDALAMQYGGAAQDIDNYGDKVTQISNAFGDFKESVGINIIDVLNDLMPSLDTAVDIFEILADEIGNMIDIAKSLADTAGLDDFFNDGSSAAQQLIAVIGAVKITLLDLAILAATVNPLISAEEVAGLRLVRQSVFTDTQDKLKEQRSKETRARVEAKRQAIRDNFAEEKRERDRLEAKESKVKREKDEQIVENVSAPAFNAAKDFVGQIMQVVGATLDAGAELVPSVKDLEAFAADGPGKSKGDPGFQAQIVGIAALNARISQSAASKEAREPLEEAKKQTGLLGEMIEAQKAGTIVELGTQKILEGLGFV
jgi:hypothetical protein